MKKLIFKLSIIFIGLGITGYVLSYYIQGEITIGLIQNLSSSLFEIGAAIIIVNLYLDRKSKKGAIVSILRFSNESIADFHNRLLDLMWTKFGQNEFGDIVSEYVKNGSRPEVIPPEKRDKIYDVIELHQTEIIQLLSTLENTLTEMIGLIGWELDAELLSYSLDARNSIRSYIKINIDDSNDSKLKTTEHLIDIDVSTQNARDILLELADIKE